MSAQTPHLSMRDVHTHIGKYHILHGLNFSIERGKVTMLLGRNGAGKSTTLKTIMGILPPSQGSIHIAGRPVGGAGMQLRTPEIARMGVAFVPEDMGVFTQLSVRQNMDLAAFRAGSVAKVDPARTELVLNLFPFLKGFWHAPAGVLSGGQKQMLAIARAILEPKELLLIDEPTKGLAPVMVKAMIEALRALKATGATILIVEQNMSVAGELGDAVVVLDDGRVSLEGSMERFAADTSLQKSLIGLSVKRLRQSGVAINGA